jgi:hypothetical protein
MVWGAAYVSVQNHFFLKLYNAAFRPVFYTPFLAFSSYRLIWGPNAELGLSHSFALLTKKNGPAEIQTHLNSRIYH